MPRSTIDYTKEILEKISFTDSLVFRKELRKAFRQLVQEDRDELKRWFRSACICRLPEDTPAWATLPERVTS